MYWYWKGVWGWYRLQASYFQILLTLRFENNLQLYPVSAFQLSLHLTSAAFTKKNVTLCDSPHMFPSTSQQGVLHVICVLATWSADAGILQKVTLCFLTVIHFLSLVVSSFPTVWMFLSTQVASRSLLESYQCTVFVCAAASLVQASLTSQLGSTVASQLISIQCASSLAQLSTSPKEEFS